MTALHTQLFITAPYLGIKLGSAMWQKTSDFNASRLQVFSHLLFHVSPQLPGGAGRQKICKKIRIFSCTQTFFVLSDPFFALCVPACNAHLYSALFSCEPSLHNTSVTSASRLALIGEPSLLLSLPGRTTKPQIFLTPALQRCTVMHCDLCRCYSPMEFTSPPTPSNSRTSQLSKIF